MRLKMMFECMAEGVIGLETKFAVFGEGSSYEYGIHGMSKVGRRLERYTRRLGRTSWHGIDSGVGADMRSGLGENDSWLDS